MNFLIYLTLIANAFTFTFAADQVCLDNVKNKALDHINANHVIFDDSCKSSLRTNIIGLVDDSGNHNGSDDNGNHTHTGIDDNRNHTGIDDRRMQKRADDSGNHSGSDDSVNHINFDDNGNHSGSDDIGNQSGTDDITCQSLTDVCSQLLLDDSCSTTTYDDCIKAITDLPSVIKSNSNKMSTSVYSFLMLYFMLML